MFRRNAREAASLSLVGGTAWETLVVRAQLRMGESILIHGGAGGVGHVAIQLAKAMGAKVFATAREANADFVRRLEVDVVFDTIGGETLARSPAALAQLGRVVSIVDTAHPQNIIARTIAASHRRGVLAR